MDKLLSFLRAAVPALDHARDLPLLFLRITLGLIFFRSGMGKFTHLGDTIEFFAALGIPAPSLQAPFVAGVELFGGLLVLVGLGTRLISVPLAFTMVIALWTSVVPDLRASDDGFTLNAFLELSEWHYLVCFLLLAVSGPGRASVDFALSRSFGHAAAGAPLKAAA